MAQYTTAALVKKRVENFDVSLADADIEAYIEEAEQILNATKHGILRAACNSYAGVLMIDFNPAGFTSLAESVAIRSSLWDQWQDLR